jgi:hypothetical protein
VTKIASFLTLLITALVCLLPAAPALAQRDRVFVASYGSDSNPCTFGSPCKTFQNAINVVAQGGEVTAIDSAGFGTFIIEHAVTITSPNGVEAGVAAPASDSSAITINAGPSDTVSLNGLTLDGDSVPASVGIRFNSGGSLEIQNSVIRNFGAHGILYEPDSSSQIFVSNTQISGNVQYGIWINPLVSVTVLGAIDHVDMENNAYGGLLVETNTATINVTVADSVSANGGTGIYAQSYGTTAISVMVRNCTIANNSFFGLVSSATAGATATVWVTRSTISGNATGWSTVTDGVVTSFNDNNIIGNMAGNTAPPNMGYQ